MSFGDGEAGEREAGGGKRGVRGGHWERGRTGGGGEGELSDKNKTQPGGKRGREREGREGKKEEAKGG